jgi:hypothetical protein
MLWLGVIEECRARLILTLTTYSYHDFLSTPSIVDYWEIRGKAVNSRNANLIAHFDRFSMELSTEITSRMKPR